MTTSGFISPAREGKLPESRTPLVPVEPPHQPTVPSVPSEPPPKKTPKLPKKVEKKREKLPKGESTPVRNKKAPPIKDVAKWKQFKNAPAHNNNLLTKGSPNQAVTNNHKQPHEINHVNKALAAARLKTEKLNTTITPIPIKQPNNVVDKLFTEPDKKKINILRKISNVKNEKTDCKMAKVKDEIKQESRESSPDLVIDETVNEPVVNKIHHISNDITIELINSTPKQENSYFDNDSPPGTPSTPKTPEIVSQSPPLAKEKRKRREKGTRVNKKLQKHPPLQDVELMEVNLDRPKTPEAAVMLKSELANHLPMRPTLPQFPFFPGFNAGPGLIPPPLSNPLFPHLPIPPLNLHSFGQPPFIPPVHPGIPLNFIPPMKCEEPPMPLPSAPTIEPPIQENHLPKPEKKQKEHKKDKKDKKKNKKEKNKEKAEKKKLKEAKKESKVKKKEKRKEKEVNVCVAIFVYY